MQLIKDLETGRLSWISGWTLHAITSILIRRRQRDFPGGPVVKTPCSQCRGPRFDPWSGNWILHVATKSPHAATKDPACRN